MLNAVKLISVQRKTNQACNIGSFTHAHNTVRLGEGGEELLLDCMNFLLKSWPFTIPLTTGGALLSRTERWGRSADLEE